MVGGVIGLCHDPELEKFNGSTGEETGEADSLGTGDCAFGDCKFNGVGDSVGCTGDSVRLISVSSDLIVLAGVRFDGYFPVRDKSSGFVLKFSGSISVSASVCASVIR